MMNILGSVKDFIREPYAWPGGYPKILFMSDGECICPTCARENFHQIVNSTKHYLRDGWQATGVMIHWEGEPVLCANCGEETDSAYGECEE